MRALLPPTTHYSLCISTQIFLCGMLLHVALVTPRYETFPRCSFALGSFQLFPTHYLHHSHFPPSHSAGHPSIPPSPEIPPEASRCFVHSSSNYIPLTDLCRLIMYPSSSLSLSFGKPLPVSWLWFGAHSQFRLASSNTIHSAWNNGNGLKGIDLPALSLF